MSSETVATLGFLIRVPFIFLFTYAVGQWAWEYSPVVSLVLALCFTVLWEASRDGAP